MACPSLSHAGPRTLPPHHGVMLAVLQLPSMGPLLMTPESDPDWLKLAEAATPGPSLRLSGRRRAGPLKPVVRQERFNAATASSLADGGDA